MLFFLLMSRPQRPSACYVWFSATITRRRSDKLPRRRCHSVSGQREAEVVSVRPISRQPGVSGSISVTETPKSSRQEAEAAFNIKILVLVSLSLFRKKKKKTFWGRQLQGRWRSRDNHRLQPSPTWPKHFVFMGSWCKPVQQAKLFLIWATRF